MTSFHIDLISLKTSREGSFQTFLFQSKNTFSAGSLLLLLTLSQHFNGFVKYDFPLLKLSEYIVFIYTPTAQVLYYWLYQFWL